MDKKTLRVALVMGGGVSLGAFSGGALSQVVRQLYELRQQGTYGDVVLDVFSGASAGGITLALLLRALANPDGMPIEAVVDEVERLEKLLWVTETGILSMLPGLAGQPAAILSRKQLEKMVVKKQGLCWEDGKAPAPSGLLANRVCFGISLMNYNGLHIHGTETPALEDAKSTTLYGDYRYFCLDFAAPPEADAMKLAKYYNRDEMSRSDAWLDLYATAIAGGAFPIAFEPVVLLRDKDEFPSKTWPQELGEGPFPFTYGDGGTFNNEPLREAMRMIGYQDGYQLNKPWRMENEQVVRVEKEEFERVLIYIDPDLAGSSSELSLSLHTSPDPTDRIVASGLRLVTAIRGQAAVKDVLSSDQVDSRLEWRHELRRLLQETVDQISPPPGKKLNLGAENKLQDILAAKQTASQNNYQHRSEIERVYWEEHRAAAKPYSQLTPEERERYSLLALVDQVADLRAKNSVRVIAIAPAKPPKEDQESYAQAVEQIQAARTKQIARANAEHLAQAQPARTRPFERIKLSGAFLGSFGGFLEVEYRDNDFQIGQIKARSVLQQVLIDSEKDATDREAGADTGLDALDSDQPLVKPTELHNHTNAREINRRLQQLIQLFLQSLAKWPIRQLARLALWIANGWIVKWLSNKLEPEPAMRSQRARLRLEIDELGENRYRLGLSGGKDGKRSLLVKADENGRVVLETSISFTQEQIRGRYVFKKANDPDRWWTRVILRKSRFRRTYRDVLLPRPDELWEIEPKPRPIRLEQLTFSWPEKLTSIEITHYTRETKDQLVPHAAMLKLLAGEPSD